MDIALLLGTIPKDSEPGGIGLQAPNKVVANAMSLARADDIGEAKGASGQLKHVAVSRDKTFTGKLARTVGRDRNTWTVVLCKRDPRIFAIHATAGSVENLGHAVYAHGFENVLSEIGAFPEIDVRLGHGFCYVRVSREMKHGVGAGHGGGDGAHVLQVRLYHFNAGVVRAFLDVRQLSRREVVEDNDAFGRAVFQERRDQMAADETRAAGNENTLPLMEKIGRHDRQCWRAGQCQPQACSSLPVRFVMGRARRKLAISQRSRSNDPIAAITNERVKWRGQ